VAVGTLAAEHSKVGAALALAPSSSLFFGRLLVCGYWPVGLSSRSIKQACPPAPLYLPTAWQVRALARELGFLSLADSLRGGSGGKVAEAAAEVAAKLRL